VRAHAIRTLDKAKVSWIEAFTGGGVSAIAAAISCLLGWSQRGSHLAADAFRRGPGPAWKNWPLA
jgi:uncharacterized membrane protein